MSIWSTVVDCDEQIEAASSTPGASMLTLDVAVAPSWGSRIRLAGWSDDEDFEIQLSSTHAWRLMFALEAALRALAVHTAIVANDGSALDAVEPDHSDCTPRPTE